MFIVEPAPNRIGIPSHNDPNLLETPEMAMDLVNRVICSEFRVNCRCAPNMVHLLELGLGWHSSLLLKVPIKQKL